MTYELAKKLKDAGFPQDVNGFIYHPKDGLGILGLSGLPRAESLDAEAVAMPTLSELVEACGNNFGQLCRLDDNKEVQWIASSPKDITVEDILKIYGKVAYLSPEEAVANLWLKLNKSK